MKISRKISAYHARVIIVYALFVPFLYFTFRNNLKYDLSRDNFYSLAAVTLGSMIIFLGFLYSKIKTRTKKGIDVSLQSLITSIAYGLIFAFPEEVIFRGLIQSSLELYTGSAGFAILLSAAIFGIAHVYNGAKGFYPRELNWKLAGLTFLAGLPLGILFALSHSLLFPTFLHAFFVTCLKATEKD